jgi:hypothetical protein
MATIDFPNSPAVDDVFTAGNSSYKWTGTAWVSNNLAEIPAEEIDGLTDFIRATTAEISTVDEAYTLVAGDQNTLIQADGTFTITVPDATIPAGARVDIVNIGTGVITFAGDDLTISSKDGALTVPAQYSGATLFFTSTTTALLIGDLA